MRMSSGDESQDEGQRYTAPVRSYRPNVWKLYDMHENVGELCLDWYASRYYAEVQCDLSGPPSRFDRVIRWGGWLNTAAGLLLGEPGRVPL